MNSVFRKMFNKAVERVMEAPAAGLIRMGGWTSNICISRTLESRIPCLTLGLIIAALLVPAASAQSVRIGDMTPCLTGVLTLPENCAEAGNASASGTNAVAIGTSTVASAANSVALGANAVANRANTVSVGRTGGERQIVNVATGTQSTDAVNKAQLDVAVRYFKANGADDGSDEAQATGVGSVAAGVGSQANGVESIALGSFNAAIGDYTSAMGYMNTAEGLNSSAVGNLNQVDGQNSSAFGFSNSVEGNHSVAIGSNSRASGTASLVAGDGATANADNAIALGTSALVSAVNAVALGAGSVADRANAISVGAVGAERQIINVGAGTQSTDAVNKAQLDAISDLVSAPENYFKSDGAADGSDDAVANGVGAIAIGRDATASAVNAVALGAGSVADRANAVSVGAVGTERQIINVGAGTQSTDAVNKAQLDAISDLASAPESYFKSDGAADGSDDAVASAASAVAIGRGAAASAINAVALGAGSVADRADAISVGAVGTERQIINVAAGTQSTDAVNKAQLDAVSDLASVPENYFKSDGAADGSDDAVASGVGAVAIGRGAGASAINAVALGAGSVADRADAISVGATGAERQIINVAAGTQSTDAVNKAQLDAVAGAAGNASRYFRSNGLADGSDDAVASAAGASAAGVGSQASGVASTAVGNHNVADGDYASAMGYLNTANGLNSSAVGNFNWVDGENSSAFGFSNRASGDNALVIGSNSVASGNGGLAAGDRAVASGFNAVALGSGSQAIEDNVVSVGGGNGSTGPATRRIVNVGEGRVAGDSTDAINGRQLNATNQRLGTVESRVDDIDARIENVEGVAINVVSYDDASRAALTLSGTHGTTLNNVAAGDVAAGSLQAINGGQLYDSLGTMASALGGGAALGMQGLFVAPTYIIQGASFDNVGDALRALDGQVTSINTRLSENGGGTGEVGGSGGVVLGNRATAPDVAGTGIGHDALAVGLNDTAVGGNARVNADGSTAVGANTMITATADNAVAIGESATVSATSGTAIGQGASVTAQGAVALGQGAVADRANTVSVGRAGDERQIVNVAAGTRDTDAVNKGQLDKGVATANAYTDSVFNGMDDRFEALRGDMEYRLRHVDRRIDRQGAMSAAMLNMSTSMAGVRTENRVGVGVGFQGGQSSLSIGYQRAFSDRATLTIGGAFSGDDSSVGMGAGFGW